MLTKILLALVFTHGAPTHEAHMTETKATATATDPDAPKAPESATQVVLQINGDLSTQQQIAALRFAPQVDPIQRFREGAATSAGTVIGAEDGYQYNVILPGDFGPAQLTSHRQRLIDEGFSPRAGGVYQGAPTGEYVVGQAIAEIWRRPQVYSDAEHLGRLCESVLSYDWAAHYRRHPRGQLPEAVDLAVQVYHGFVPAPPGKARPTAEQVKALVWKHVKVHPGGPAPQDRVGW